MDWTPPPIFFKLYKITQNLLRGRDLARLRPGTLFIGGVKYNAKFQHRYQAYQNTANLSDR